MRTRNCSAGGIALRLLGRLDQHRPSLGRFFAPYAFNEWTEIFGSERLTGALLDRLTHHVHILELNGESYRLEHSKKARPPAAAPVP